jgi:hypothetical protein
LVEQDSIVLRSVFTAGALAVLLSGCGSGGKVAPVSGVITLNGQPTAGIAVSFEPIATGGNNVPGPAAFGVSGPDGRYTAKVVGGEMNGATTGKNRVKLFAYIDPADIMEDGSVKTKPKVKVPTRYLSDSKIEFDVPAKGTSSADFALTTP